MSKGCEEAAIGHIYLPTCWFADTQGNFAQSNNFAQDNSALLDNFA